MANGVRTARVYHFGAFTVDARTGELTHAGRRTPLRDQSVQLLLALLEQPGELITREELTGRLWAAGTFVDFDRGLNKAVNHLREALGDSAEQPTIHRDAAAQGLPVHRTGNLHWRRQVEAAPAVRSPAPRSATLACRCGDARSPPSASRLAPASAAFGNRTAVSLRSAHFARSRSSRWKTSPTIPTSSTLPTA